MQCGVIEVVPDSKSRDQIGKETDITLHQYFIQTYGEESSLEFQSVSLEFKKKNFLENHPMNIPTNFTSDWPIGFKERD